MKNILFVVCLFWIVPSFCQENNIIQIQREATFCKIWGFLKYYHPNVANGNREWDEEFIQKLELVTKAADNDEISKIYIDWINSLGPVKKCNSCAKPSDKKYFDRNLNLAWISNPELFHEEVIEKLVYIKNNRFQGSHFYVRKRNVGNIEIINESKRTFKGSPEMSERLLSLAKFWNTVEYFYPYKYLTDQNWDSVLVEMIPKFNSAKDLSEYELAMLETVVKLDDGHGIFKTSSTVNYFGDRFFPADLKITEDKAVVVGLPNDSLAKVHDLRIGDVIVKINGESISEIIERKYRYLHGSNRLSKLRNTYMYLANGNSSQVDITFLDKGVLSTKLINRYPYEEIHANPKPQEKYRIIDNKIGYVNMAELEMKDVDKMMSSFNDLPGIIIDLRNYPKFIPYNLAGRFVKNSKNCIDIIEPDLSYPGRFTFQRDITLKPDNDYYKGYVVLLVNENTQSRAEFSAMLFQSADRIITIGSQTAGADGNISTVNFSSEYPSLLSGTGIYYPDGTETQRKGVKLDIEVDDTVESIQSGTDFMILKAIEQINKSH